MTAFGLPDDRPILDSKLMSYEGDERPKSLIVLDRIEPGVPAAELPYCTHGRATCAFCREWCWLGHATHDVVANGEAMPICKECANRIVPKDHPVTRRIRDHRRADGPH